MTGISRSMVSGGWRAGLTRLFWLILLILPGLAVSAADQESPEPLMLGERPPGNGEPTIVEIGVHTFDIDEIDDVASDSVLTCLSLPVGRTPASRYLKWNGRDERVSC